MYRQSQAQRRSPADIFGIRSNPWLAYQFDNAVLLFGNWVEGKLKETDYKGKPKHKIESLLADPAKKKKNTINVGQLMNRPGVLVK